MLHNAATISRGEFETRTGWLFKPEGACKGDVCIPLSNPPTEEVDLAAVADQMGLPLVSEPEQNLWALGPEAIGSRALTTAAAPGLTLPDVAGKPFDLASLRGKKVLIYAWAPY